MANTPIPSFALTGKASIIASATSQNVSLSVTGTPDICVVNNLSAYPAYVLLGTTDAVVAASSTSVYVPPFSSIALTLGSNTFLAAIGNGPLDIALGT